MQLGPEMKKAAAIAAALAVLLCVVVLSRGPASSAQAYELWVDGKSLGYVVDQVGVNTVVDCVLQERAKKDGREAILVSKVDTTKSDYKGKMTPIAELQAALALVLKTAVKGCVIEANGSDAVAVGSKAEAEAVISGIKAAHEQSLKRSGNVWIEELRVNEDIVFVEKGVEAADIWTVEDAQRILIRGTDKIVIHTVQRGDSLWAIAKNNNIAVDNLRRANAELRGDRLDIGQKLNLAVADPYITITSVERLVQSVGISYRTEVQDDPDRWPWQIIIKQPGVYGKKEVTLEIKRQSGKEVSRRVLNEQHLSDPVTQILVQGSKTTPALGTGEYAWPTLGQITSRFGTRRAGQHNGLDIAAPLGTTICAADAGTVTFAGAKPYYGRMVMLDHGGGRVITVYGHCSELLVKVGDVVDKGQPIGKVGSSGRSTGPHLHFEVREEGNPQNPIAYYPGAK